MTTEINILYLGLDTGYYNTLQEKFIKVYPDLKFNFSQDHLSDDLESHKYMIKLTKGKIKFDIIYIDYSKGLMNYLKFSKFLSEQVTTKEITSIGLLDNSDDQSYLEDILLSGIKIHHIKSIELSDVVFDAMTLKFPKLAKPNQVALAKNINLQWTADNYFRVGYLTPQYVHIETDIPLPLQQSFNNKILNLNIIQDFPKNLENIHLKVERELKENFYYPLNFSYDLYYTTPTKEGVSVDDWNKVVSRKLKLWIQDNVDRSKPKRTKILIIDSNLSILNQSKQYLDSFPFSIRVHQKVDLQADIVKKVKPGIIVYSYEKKPVEESSHASKEHEGAADKNSLKNKDELSNKINYHSYNDLNALNLICQQIKKVEGYQPFIFVFDCPHKMETLKEKLGYAKIITFGEMLYLDLILKIINTYDVKDGRKSTHDPLKSYGDKEMRYYINKNSIYSRGTYKLDVQIDHMSESMLFFTSPVALPPFTTLRFTGPLKFQATVLPPGEDKDNNKGNNSKNKIGYRYQSLINLVGELEKKDIRQFINDIFCREKELLRQKELEEIEKLKEKFKGTVEQEKTESQEEVKNKNPD